MDVDIELAKQAIQTKICDKSDLNLQQAANGIITRGQLQHGPGHPQRLGGKGL